MTNLPTPSEEGFFVAGGPMRPDAASYVTRQADHELVRALEAGVYCHVSAPYQMGKSSLMARAAARLRDHGAHVAAVDLAAIGQNVTLEQWYGSLLSSIGRQLDLEDALEAFWELNQRHEPGPRFLRALTQVVPDVREIPTIILFDEIDALVSAPVDADEFLASIRGLGDSRDCQPRLARMSFCLLGSTTPGDLVRDPGRAPFPICRNIELTDFTREEMARLAEGLVGLHAASLLDRVFYWTAGHPYLTQRLCQTLAEAPGPETDADVDAACQRLFLWPEAIEHEGGLTHVRERLVECEELRPRLLRCYREVALGGDVSVADDREAAERLRLAGVVSIIGDTLRPRNRIYAHVFNVQWVSELLGEPAVEMPAAVVLGQCKGVPAVKQILRRPGEMGDYFWQPMGFCIDIEGNTYVADTMRHRIQRIAADGALAAFTGSRETGGRIRLPADVAVDSLGRMFVLESDYDRITILDADGAHRGAFSERGVEPGRIRSAQALCLNRSGQVVVADTGNDRVQVFTPVGEFVSEWCAMELGGLEEPAGVWAGCDGELIVCDSGNGRVLSISPDGARTREHTGGGEGRLVHPVAACRDAHRCLWVLDDGLGAVLQYDADGLFLLKIGPALDQWGELRDPRDIAFAPNGDLYILDTGNDRILRIMHQ